MSWFYYSKSSLGTTEFYQKGDECIPACYLYENENKKRFLIFTFGAHKVKGLSEWHNGLFRNYYRQRQVVEGYEWLCGKALPAVCEKHPNTYLLCKREKNRMHVGVWNISPDPILSPVITLDKNYRLTSIYMANGKLVGRELRLDSPVQPYGFFLFTVEE